MASKIGLVSVLVCGAVSCGSPRAEEVSPACTYEFIWDSALGAGTGVYAYDAATTETVRLTAPTDSGAYSRFPGWSPDGRHIVSVSKTASGVESLSLMASDGSDPRELATGYTGLENPAWSPDGDKIAFVADRDGSWGVFLAFLDGSPVRQMGPTPSLHPSWSPDAEWIAFVGAGTPEYDAYIMKADGTDVRRLTHTPEVDEASVSWSPEGDRIALDGVAGTNFDLYVIDRSGDNLRRLTQGPAVDARPEWSPDGTRLVFHSTRDGGGVAGEERWNDFEVYVLDLQDGVTTRLTENRSFDAHPDWCPAGPSR